MAASPAAPQAGIKLPADSLEFFSRVKAIAGKDTLYAEITKFFHREGGRIGGKVQKAS